MIFNEEKNAIRAMSEKCGELTFTDQLKQLEESDVGDIFNTSFRDGKLLEKKSEDYFKESSILLSPVPKSPYQSQNLMKLLKNNFNCQSEKTCSHQSFFPDQKIDSETDFCFEQKNQSVVLTSLESYCEDSQNEEEETVVNLKNLKDFLLEGFKENFKGDIYRKFSSVEKLLFKGIVQRIYKTRFNELQYL